MYSSQFVREARRCLPRRLHSDSTSDIISTHSLMLLFLLSVLFLFFSFFYSRVRDTTAKISPKKAFIFNE